MPVYNGERYIREALDSILAQDFEDFELLISDNVSTDATEEICRDYAARDDRIRYSRNDRNLGAAANYNRVFGEARGEFFKWAAHDDVCAPSFLRRCVETMDSSPAEVVLCVPRVYLIDAAGVIIEPDRDDFDIRGTGPVSRLGRFNLRVSRCNAVCGLIRSEVLRETRLIGHYVGSDVVLLAELAMKGSMWQIPEFLFYRRIHEDCSRLRNRSARAAAQWFDPNSRQCHDWAIGPRVTYEQVRSIGRSSLPAPQKLACVTAVLTCRCYRRARVRGGAAKQWLRRHLHRAVMRR